MPNGVFAPGKPLVRSSDRGDSLHSHGLPVLNTAKGAASGNITDID